MFTFVSFTVLYWINTGISDIKKAWLKADDLKFTLFRKQRLNILLKKFVSIQRQLFQTQRVLSK